MTADYPGRTPRYSTVGTSFMGDWRDLERLRVQALKARGKEPRYVSWECHHGTHDPLPTPSVHAHKRGFQFQIKAKDAA